jgi:hypothetical protein
VCRSPTAVLLSATAAACILIAGCGDGGNDHLAKAEFLTKGNAICKKGTAQISAASEKAFASPSQPTKQETAAFAKQTLVPKVQSQIDQLRDLSPPKNDEAQVKAILDQAQFALDKVKADPLLLVQVSVFEKANNLAKDYGLTACAG